MVGAALWAVLLGLLCGVTTQPACAGSWSVLRHEYEGNNKRHIDNYPEPPSPALDQILSWSEMGSMYNSSTPTSGTPKGSGGWGQNSGRVRTVFKWMRNRIGYGSGSTFDPNDNPPSVLYLRLSMSASASATSDSRENAPNRDVGKEKVSATALGKTGAVWDTGSGKSLSVQAVRVVRVATGGQEEVPGPGAAWMPKPK